jgi:hypothetical protein
LEARGAEVWAPARPTSGVVPDGPYVLKAWLVAGSDPESGLAGIVDVVFLDLVPGDKR